MLPLCRPVTDQIGHVSVGGEPVQAAAVTGFGGPACIAVLFRPSNFVFRARNWRLPARYSILHGLVTAIGLRMSWPTWRVQFSKSNSMAAALPQRSTAAMPAMNLMLIGIGSVLGGISFEVTAAVENRPIRV